ncbi:calpain catalytic domain-containing protein [Pseudoscourfieldia marina]
MGASASTVRGAEGKSQRRMIKLGTAAAQFRKAKAHVFSKNAAALPAHQAHYFIVERSAECAKEKHKYTDTTFPKDIDPNHVKSANVVWKRPRAFSKTEDPSLFVDGVDFMDIVSGAYAGSALHAALCVLAASRPDKIKELFVNLPEGDDKENPFGIYGVKLYYETRWYVVVVDDLIPCNDKTGQPLFVRSETEHEFWPCIVEKAIAKLHGGYNKIRSLHMRDIWPTLTGGLSHVYSIKEFDKSATGKANKPAQADSDFWGVLQSWQHVRGFMCISSDTRSSEMGILSNHAYAILECVEARGHRLVRLRNPAMNVEWKGAWSDDSELWTQEMREAVGEEKVVSKKDGNFWMGLSDLRATFSTLYVARDDFARLPTARVKSMWSISGGTAGGPPRTRFDEENPVVLLRMGEESTGEVGVVPSDAGSLVETNRLLTVGSSGDKKKDKKLLELKAGKRALIVLEQKNLRTPGADGDGRALPAIAFAVFKVNQKKGESPKLPLHDRLNRDIMDEVVTTVEPQSLLQVHCDVMLLPGVNYFVVPYTKSMNVENEFVLKVFCEVPMETTLLNQITSTAVRMRAIHPKCRMESASGTWLVDAPKACHPALVRGDPPPERTFDQSPRYKLTVQGKGKAKGMVRVCVQSKQAVEKLDVVDPLSQAKCIAFASVSGHDVTAGYRTLDDGSCEIIINNGVSCQTVRAPVGVDVKFSSNTVLIINGTDEARVKEFGRMLREKGKAQLVNDDRYRIEYLDPRQVLQLEIDVGSKTTFSQQRSNVKHTCVRIKGPGFGAAKQGDNLIVNLGPYGSSEINVPSALWVDIFVESQEVEVAGTAELVIDVVRDLRKAGFATAGADPSTNDMHTWQMTRGKKKQLESLGEVVKSSWSVEPLEELPKAPAFGVFVQNAKGLFLKETNTYNIWQGADVACRPDGEEIWLDLTVSKGEYFIIPVPGAKGFPFSNNGRYHISVFSNMDIELTKAPLQLGFPPLPTGP